jgi:hypothetical protein
MIIKSRGSIGARVALAIVCLACALLAPATGALGAESAIHYEKESLQAYEQQLAGGLIESVTINKFLRTLRITLKNGKHVLARYAAHEEPKTAEALSAKHVQFTVLSKEAATKEGGHKTKHKLRYIAGGVVVLVIIIAAAVLLLRRKRYGGD